MDLNEMRKKFREKKAQEEVSSMSQNVEDNSIVPEEEHSMNTIPAKSGDSSTVSLSDFFYEYEKGADHVTGSCSKLNNTSDETTGLLSLCCWISEKERENGNWQNDNYAIVDSVELGFLEKGQFFHDINHTFKIPENLQKTIKNVNEWRFIFTINELHEDGNRYIISTINCENEGNKFPILSDSFTIAKNQDDDLFAYKDGEEFTGTLYSSDGRFEIEFEKSVATFFLCYHKNGYIAVVGKMSEETGALYDDQDNEINENEFEKKYGQEFEAIINAGFDELESKIDNNTSNYNTVSNYGNSSVFEKVKDIVIDKLGVDPYEVVESASFMNDLGADSLDAVELIMEFEKEFFISIPDEIAERIRTVGDAVRYLEKHV